MKAVIVTVPVKSFFSKEKDDSKEIQVKADEIHISSNGVLVLRRYGNVVECFAAGEWLRAKESNQ
ncbi:hypothetical protein LAh9_811 [Aeromonas phage LAh_9]|uniref:Uncharacterized protein n=2 Tax=Lahexavirus TaxID=2843411 RepID=A0A514A125_9CAUD|nr:hypothetical protein HWC29_gp006 [Aeromonas phage 4_4572]YP_009847562.1 hypothetical protein HWC32_gp081 [Aeromonas phage LAh_9]QDH46980.1 hypothetical protein LAh9_811 [Aeromonas phage LAh_9]QEG09004.1 hypothetical protein [Aeromonas phage 4_4572]